MRKRASSGWKLQVALTAAAATLLALACGCGPQPAGSLPGLPLVTAAAPAAAADVPAEASAAREPAAQPALAVLPVAEALAALLPEQARRAARGQSRQERIGQFYGMLGYQYSNEMGSLDRLGGGHGFKTTVGLLRLIKNKTMGLGFEGAFDYGIYSSGDWGRASLNRLMLGLRIVNLQSGYYFLVGASYNTLEFDEPLQDGMNSKGIGGYAGFGYMYALAQNGRWYVACDTTFHMWGSDSSVAGSGTTLTVCAGVYLTMVF